MQAGSTVANEAVEDSDIRQRRFNYQAISLLYILCAGLVVVFDHPRYNQCPSSSSLLYLPLIVAFGPLILFLFRATIAILWSVRKIFIGKATEVPPDVVPFLMEPIDYVRKSYASTPRFTTVVVFAFVAVLASHWFRFDERFHGEYVRIHDRLTGRWFTQHVVTGCPSADDDDDDGQ